MILKQLITTLKHKEYLEAFELEGEKDKKLYIDTEEWENCIWIAY